MPAPDELRAAVERTARAVMEGDFAQIMASITPDALAQMMQMAAANGGVSIANLPSISGYEVAEVGEEPPAHLFDVTFTSEAGTARLGSAWELVVGQWKITRVTVASVTPSEETAEAPAGEETA